MLTLTLLNSINTKEIIINGEMRVDAEGNEKEKDNGGRKE
jgi:hypothetical protein